MTSPSANSFPTGFLWGAATSAYQIEGSPLADGAGESIWHRFAHTAGTIDDGTNGDLACDHYHRFREDLRLMRDLGLRAYRFSISWSRVLPAGTGKQNDAGLDFYQRLVDALLENGIRPMATLYHWDLPQALEARGGWTAPAVVDWFTEYAQLMYRALDDRVPLWATINEPWVIMDQGYITGRHAPGKRNWSEAALASKNLLKAHAAATAAYRALGRHEIGLVVNLVPIHAASDSAADRHAANRLDAYFNRQFLDPVLLGRIPPELPEMFGAAWPRWTADELQQVKQPIDFVGINYYLRLVVRDDPAEGPARARAERQVGRDYTAMNWEVYPQGLTDTLKWVMSRYGAIPQYITENGAAFEDIVQPNQGVMDSPRVEYLRSHLLAAQLAMDQGVDLRGYFVWSLLDNFEWQCGFSKRFGVVYVDFETLERVPKASARFYSDVIRSNGARLR